MAVEGQQTWRIGGEDYSIESTYYLALPEGLQYTINYNCDCPDQAPFTNESALRVARPLMSYAVSHQLYKRTNISKLGAGQQSVSLIGVAIIYRREGVGASGFRISQPLASLIRTLDESSVATGPENP